MLCKYIHVSIVVLIAPMLRILFCFLSVLFDEEINCVIYIQNGANELLYFVVKLRGSTLRYSVIMVWIHIYCMYVCMYKFIFWNVGLNEPYSFRGSLLFNWRSFILSIKPQLKCLSLYGIHSKTYIVYFNIILSFLRLKASLLCIMLIQETISGIL